MKLIKHIFIMLIASAVSMIAFRAPNGVETDLYALADSGESGVLGDIAKSMASQGRVLIEGDDFQSLTNSAVQIRRQLTGTNTIARDYKATLNYLDKHKSGLLSSSTRDKLLDGKYDEVARESLARLFSPIPRILSVKDDPFLLATDYVTQLQSGLSGDWTLRDGFLTCDHSGHTCILENLDLTSTPPSAITEFIKTHQSSITNHQSPITNHQTPKLYCGGAPFHAAVASERSKSEIGILSAISIVCVLLLGWRLFKSFKFLPALLLAQFCAFVVATGILFLVYPRPHVLTFVFGTSLIGLSVDYVYHALSVAKKKSLAILKPLTLSMLTTVACFAPLLFADVTVLRQMALFSISGIIATFAFVVLFICNLKQPVSCALSYAENLTSHRENDTPPDGNSSLRTRNTLATKISGFLKCGNIVNLAVIAFILPAACGIFRLNVFQNPAEFYKPDAYLVASEKKIAELNPSHSMRFAFVRGSTLQEALEREESLGIKGLSAVIPSIKRQKENALLVAKLIENQGKSYSEKTGLKLPYFDRHSSAFHSSDNHANFSHSFMDASDITEEPLASMVRSMWLGGGLVSPLADGVEVPEGVEILEPKAALENLFAKFTSATLKLLSWSFGVFVVILAVMFRRRMLEYFLPVASALVATAGVLGWIGIGLTFFNMLCFFVLAGLGIDYVIFQLSSGRSKNSLSNDTPSHKPATHEPASHDAVSVNSTARIVRFSFLTSFVGLGSLAFTCFPVTRSMGITFAVGLLFSWVFSRIRFFPCHQPPTTICKSPMTNDQSPTTNNQPPTTKKAWHEQREQSAGELRLRVMWLIYAWCGKDLQKIVTFFVMLCVYPFAKPAREALKKFYDVLRERDASFNPGAFTAFCHMLGFAWALADKTDACTLKKNLPKMVVRDDDGWKSFSRLVNSGKGAFLISTHVGTIEVLPALAESANTRVPHVHAFQQMGHDAVFTKMFMRHFDASSLTLHAVEDIGVETAVQMQHAIAKGELVLMAGDRVSAGSGKTLKHEFLGRDCSWPKGVFAFAKLMESPVFFVTCVSTGWNKYECRFEKYDSSFPLTLPNLLDRYVRFLETETISHPTQWFQFYDFFSSV